MLNNLSDVWIFEKAEYQKTEIFCDLIIRTYPKRKESYKLIFSVFSLFLTINKRLNRKIKKAIFEQHFKKVAFLISQRKQFSNLLFLEIQPIINNNLDNSIIAWEKTFCTIFGFKNVELTKESEFLKKLELFTFHE